MTADDHGHPPGFCRIVFCTDFSENAYGAFALAVDAAQRNPGAGLTLIHVIPEPEAQFWRTYIYELDNVDAQARRDIDARIDADYRSRVPASVPFKVEMRIGNPAQQILAFLEEAHADLVIMGRQGHGAFETLLFGNIAGKVARRAACPVLLIPLDYTRKAGLSPPVE